MTPVSTRVDRSARLGACVERARRGERAALDEVVRELNPLLWHVARAQGLGVEDATDVVQTGWPELLRRLDDTRSPEAQQLPPDRLHDVGGVLDAEALRPG